MSETEETFNFMPCFDEQQQLCLMLNELNAK